VINSLGFCSPLTVGKVPQFRHRKRRKSAYQSADTGHSLCGSRCEIDTNNAPHRDRRKFMFPDRDKWGRIPSSSYSPVEASLKLVWSSRSASVRFFPEAKTMRYSPDARVTTGKVHFESFAGSFDLLYGRLLVVFLQVVPFLPCQPFHPYTSLSTG
jgi:hypothetical protein